MSRVDFARTMAEYFVRETFYTLWYPLRHSVNLVEIYGIPNAANLLLKRFSRTIFVIIAWTTVHKTPREIHPRTDADAKPDLPSEAIYIDVLKAVRSYPNLPAPPDIPTPGEFGSEQSRRIAVFLIKALELILSLKMRALLTTKD